MAGNRLFFPVQAVMFYSGRAWDRLESWAKDSANRDPVTGDPNYDVDDSVRPTTHVAHGIQDVNVVANFTLTPVFELGQAAVYENTEGIPTVEITLQKVLDGRPLIWHMATMDATSPELIARTGVYSTFQLGLWPDSESQSFWLGDQTFADDHDEIVRGDTDSVTPIGVITCPKCFPSTLGYTVNMTESAMENVTLAGNEKVWARAKSFEQLTGLDREGNETRRTTRTIIGDARFDTARADFNNEDRPLERIIQGYNTMLRPLIATWDPAANDGRGAYEFTSGVVDRDKNGAINDPDCSVFPIEMPGVNSYGVNDVEMWINEAEGVYNPQPNFARIQSVAFNITLTRNDINTMGYKMPAYRSVQLPIAVATEIVVVSTTDDGINVEAFSSACQNTSALRPQTIRLALCNGDPPTAEPGEELGPSEASRAGDINGVRLYAGMQNKLTSVAFGQGGTGGGNVQATFSYATNNDFTVLAKSDPSWRNGTRPILAERDDETGVSDVIGYETVDGELTDPNSTVTQAVGWWPDRRNWVCGRNAVPVAGP